MNLVQSIVNQLTGQVSQKLGSMLGTDSETAESAVGAAVPAMLAGLAGLATREDGVRKLTSALGGLDSGGITDFASMLGGDSNALMQKGTNLLGSLLGESMLSPVFSAIGNYTGLDRNTIKSLFGYLAPLVLGQVASQWKSRGGTAQALTGLFAEQKDNIAKALPAGLSLPQMPDFGRGAEAARSTAREVETAAAGAGSPASWMLPLAIALVAGALLWNFLRPQPAADQAASQKPDEPKTVTAMKPVSPAIDMTDGAHVTDDLTNLVKSLTATLASIKDPASAEAAAPQLEDVSTKLDGLRAVVGRLPEMSRTSLQKVFSTQYETLKQSISEVSSIPGLSYRIKALINLIMEKLTALNESFEAK